MNKEQFDKLLKSIYELKRDLNWLTPPANGVHPMSHSINSIRKAKEYMQLNFPKFEPPQEIDLGVNL